jgi:Mg-chelatase subunit ChlD
VVVQVAVCAAVLVGFGALAVDVGYLYCTQAELQRTADAAAMAAAGELANYADGDPLVRARQAAQDLAARNTVLGTGILLDPGADLTFGRAVWDGTRYSFTPTEVLSNAVRVRARRTADSPNGAVPLFFANVFGQSRKDMSAEATAILTPRDVVFVLDLSGSHRYDSCLRSYKRITIANRDVWESLWDSALAQSLGVPRPTENGEPAGPYIGNMRLWGAKDTNASWNFANDPGLVRLPKTGTWTLTGAYLSQTLSAKGFGSYVSAEVSAVNTTPSSYKSGDGATLYYRRRVRVALGLDRWKSGKAGGQTGGNGDNYIDASEIAPMVPYPSSSSNPDTLCKQVGGNWDSFVDYVANSGSSMCQYAPDSEYWGDPGLQYRFGLKTFTDFLQVQEAGDSTSPGLAGAPEQPMGAVADATKTAIEIIRGLDGNDMIGLASYGTIGYGPGDKPNHMSWLTDDFDGVTIKVNKLQARMWTDYTNIAQGINKGLDVLMNSPVSSERAHAAKVMILLTDGNANQTLATPASDTGGHSPYYNPTQAKADAVARATAIAAQGVQIFTISVGITADQALMEQIAAIGHGEHFHAEGSVESYRQQLETIFEKLGGERPVQLIQ